MQFSTSPSKSARYSQVVRRRNRRPKVSMVQIAGAANRKFKVENPRDAPSAAISVNPDSTKMVEL